MSKYQAYPEYKDSGVEWIGNIPVHWKTASLSKLFNIKAGGDVKTDFFSEEMSEAYPFPIYTNANDEKSIYGYTSKSYFPGDTITVSGRGEVGFAAYRDSAYDAIIRLLVLIPINKVSGMFFTYFVNEVVEFRVESSAIGQLSTQQIAPYKVAFPSYVEQTAIANYLDHETAKIDTLIDKQQQLIRLLKEKRQAVISHAVTKGLNPNAPMRDSGVEWLGEVPEHWSFPKVKWFFKTESGGTPNTSRYEEYYQDGDIPWIRSTDLNNNELFETPIAITSKAIRESACTVIPTNSVLIAMYGGAGTIGKHALLKFESAINQAVCAILPTNKINPDFLHLYVEFYRPYWMVGAEGARKDPNINQETIRELVVSSPPYDEQVEIVKVIQQKIAVIDQTVSKCEKNIQLMQERRTALISAAVTGKIDVRDWQAPAPMQNKEAV